jgi:hypothetical protein
VRPFQAARLFDFRMPIRSAEDASNRPGIAIRGGGRDPSERNNPTLTCDGPLLCAPLRHVACARTGNDQLKGSQT